MIYVYLSDSFTVTSLALPSVNKGFKAKKACLLDDKQKVKTSQKGGIITLQGLTPSHRTNVTIVALEMNRSIQETHKR